MPSRFYFDTVLDEVDICNLHSERTRIAAAIGNGEKILLYGRRNSGKTSLAKVMAAKWKAGPGHGGMFVYVDFYGVASMTQIASRLSAAMAEGYKKAFPARAALSAALEIAKSLRPKMDFDPDGEISVSLGLTEGPNKGVSEIIAALGTMKQRKIPVLLVMDEFQDIHQAAEAEGILRGCLQTLPHDIPVIILGSKRHLLTTMFNSPNAAFFNWGTHIEFGDIPYDEYWGYMSERFAEVGLSISKETSRILQDELDRVPEAINRVCARLCTQFRARGELQRVHVHEAVRDLVESRQSTIEQYLGRFTEDQERALLTLARRGGLEQHPMSRDFTAAARLSLTGARKIFAKLEAESAIYRRGDGAYLFTDPLVRLHLLRFRGN